MKDINIIKGLGYFPMLSKLKVKNFFTFDNKVWGNMRYTENPSSLTRLNKAFKLVGIKSKKYICILSKHDSKVQFLNHRNLQVYGMFNREEEIKGSIEPLRLYIDGLITKLSFPIVIAPADCVVLVIYGKDSKDRKKFIMVLHLGVSGTYLKLHEKALKQAHMYYKFKNKDLKAFLFPYIHGENYLKTREDDTCNILNKKEWKKYLIEVKNKIEVDFGRKIKDDLEKFDIKCIYDSELDTYEECKKGKLFSHTYLKEKRLGDTKRFAIGVSL